MRIDLLGLIEGVLLVGGVLNVIAAFLRPGAEGWACAAFAVVAASYVRSHRCPVAVLEIREADDAG